MLWVEVVVVEYKPSLRLLAKPTFACVLGLKLHEPNLGLQRSWRYPSNARP